MTLDSIVAAAERATRGCGHWLRGTAGACNVVSFCGDDITGIAIVPDEVRAIHIANCSPEIVIALCSLAKAAREWADVEYGVHYPTHQREAEVANGVRAALAALDAALTGSGR